MVRNLRLVATEMRALSSHMLTQPTQCLIAEWVVGVEVVVGAAATTAVAVTAVALAVAVALKEHLFWKSMSALQPETATKMLQVTQQPNKANPC